jgi:hypothetical protein
MLFSLAQKPNPSFNRTLWKDDWKALNPEKQEAIAMNAAQRAKNAEIELGSTTDMGISIGTDFLAVLTTAVIAGQTKAKRQALMEQWEEAGGDREAEPMGPFFKGEGGKKDPTGVLGWWWLPKTFLVPVVLWGVSLFDTGAKRFLKEGGFVSLLTIVAGMVESNLYNRRLPKEKEKLSAVGE